MKSWKTLSAQVNRAKSRALFAPQETKKPGDRLTRPCLLVDWIWVVRFPFVNSQLTYRKLTVCVTSLLTLAVTTITAEVAAAGVFELAVALGADADHV